MTKYVCLLSVFILQYVYSFAQHTSVTSVANGLRSGDRLQRHYLTCFSDGDGGNDRIWTYSDANVSEQEHSIEYYSLSDTIVGAVNGTRYFYRQSGDTLYTLGFDNRNSHITYNHPIPVIRYPYTRGDSISCTFTGSGIYGDHLYLGIVGRCHTVADACGMIVCGEDTVTDILRVHHHRETLQKSGYDRVPVVNTDSLDLYISNADDIVVEDIFYYYKSGYRYPVITSVSCSSLSGGQRFPHSGYTVIYTLRQQECDIHYDPENENMRAYDVSSGRISAKNSSDMSDVFSGITATSDGHNVYVHYDTSTSLPVTFTVYDALSHQMSATYIVDNAGDIALPLLYSTPNVLLLYVTCGDSSAVLKIPMHL